MAKIDEIIAKCKNNESLTEAENKYLYSKLNLIFGDVANDKDQFQEKYPMILIKCIVGYSDYGIQYTSFEEEIEFTRRLEYIFNHYMEEEEVLILKTRFMKKASLDDTAEIFKMSREKVRQIEVKALRKLRHPSRLNIILCGNEIIKLANEKKEKYEKMYHEYNEKIQDISNKMKILDKALQDTGVNAGVKLVMDKDYRDLDNFDLSVRSYHCLKRAGINTVQDLREKSLSEMKKVRNLGTRSLK